MRVLHFCWTFSPLTETFIYDQVLALEARGLESHVLCLARENEADRPFANTHIASQVAAPPHKTDPGRLLAKLRSVMARENGNGYYREYIRRTLIGKFLDELRPDVVHAHFGPAAALIAPVAARRGIPLVVTFYGYDASSLPKDPKWVAEYTKLFRHAAVLSTVSEVMGERLAAIGAPREKLRVIRLGKRMADYPFRAPNGPVRTWVSVGRLAAKKGHIDCIQAFDRLAEEVPDARLQIIGGGELLEPTQRAVEQAKHGDRIALLGPLQHREALRLMQEADAFVLCSKTAPSGDEEGTPTVLLEAQALGLPCVTTRHAGIPESIPPENQWLLSEEGDVAGIAERMRKLTACSARELEAIVQAGRTKVEQEFNVEREAERLEGWYAELTSRVPVAAAG